MEASASAFAPEPAGTATEPTQMEAAPAETAEGGVEDGESSDSEAEEEGFDYAALEEAQRIAGGGEAAATGEGAPLKRKKQRGGNKESQKRRKRQKREDDLLRAKQAGLKVPSLREALKAAAAAKAKAAAKATASPSIARGSISYADAMDSGPTETAAAPSSSSSAAPPQASVGATAEFSPAVVARLARESARRAKSSQALKDRTLFITNLSFKMSEQEIREWIGASGTIKELKLARDKTTTRVLGYAHVQFEDASMAAAAVQRCDRQELHGRFVRVLPVGTKCQFELPEEIQEDIRALLREAYEGKNLSTVKDAWQKRHPGQKLDTSKWGFKNFSAAVATIEGITLEHHLEKKLTNLAFFKDSPAHVAFLEDKSRRAEEAAAAPPEGGADGARKRAAAPGDEAPEAKRRRAKDANEQGGGGDRPRAVRKPCGCVIC